MTMADTLIYLLIAAAFVIGSTAMWMLHRSLWPLAFAKRMSLSQTGVLRNLLVGLIPAVLIAIVITVAGKKLGLLAVLVFAASLAYGLMGLAGYAAVIGERLWPKAQAWRQSRNGGLVLICVALFPVVGWFFLFPVMMIIGLGVNVRAKLGKTSPASEAA